MNYTDEMDAFIKESAPIMSIDEIVCSFNERYGTSVTHTAIQQRLNKKLSCRAVNRYHHIFTKAEMEWVENQYLGTMGTCSEIAKLFNETFCPIKPVSAYSISDLATKRMKLKRGFNKGQFGRGKTKPHAPVGTIYGTGAYKRIKVASEGNYYQALHAHIYEEANGPLKPDEIVIFADGDHTNLSPDNLIAVSRATNAYLAKNGMHKLGIITKAASETMEAIKLINEMEVIQ